MLGGYCCRITAVCMFYFLEKKYCSGQREFPLLSKVHDILRISECAAARTFVNFSPFEPSCPLLNIEVVFHQVILLCSMQILDQNSEYYTNPIVGPSKLEAKIMHVKDLRPYFVVIAEIWCPHGETSRQSAMHGLARLACPARPGQFLSTCRWLSFGLMVAVMAPCRRPCDEFVGDGGVSRPADRAIYLSSGDAATPSPSPPPTDLPRPGHVVRPRLGTSASCQPQSKLGAVTRDCRPRIDIRCSQARWTGRFGFVCARSYHVPLFRHVYLFVCSRTPQHT